MNKEYELTYYASGDLDERLFIDQMEQIGTPSKIQTSFYHQTPNRAVPDQMILQSPYRAATAEQTIPQTPISSTMDHVSWLQHTLLNRPDTPTPNLIRYFQVASPAMRDTIESRVRSLIGELSTIFHWNLTHHFAERVIAGGNIENARAQLAVKFYYKVLEHMLVTEEARLRQDNFSTLLSHDIFHTSLLACCLDVVVHCYQMEKLEFPAFVRLFKINPFDYTKIIENVVRNEPEVSYYPINNIHYYLYEDINYILQLPRGIVRHLVHTEEMIVEQLGWEEGSPIFNLLPTTQEELRTLYNHLISTSGGTGVKRDNIAVLASPVSKQKPEDIKSPNGKRPPFSHSLDVSQPILCYMNVLILIIHVWTKY